eukprot:scaffold7619_cov73-Isochrysis_galbana.AAC.2
MRSRVCESTRARPASTPVAVAVAAPATIFSTAAGAPAASEPVAAAAYEPADMARSSSLVQMDAPQLLQGTGVPDAPVAGTHVPQLPQITSGTPRSMAPAGTPSPSQHRGAPERGCATKRGECGITSCSADAIEEDATATMARLRRGIGEGGVD